MTTIMSSNELTRKALAWIAEERSARGLPAAGATGLNRIIDEAAARFNLSPLDVEFLQRTLAQEPAEDAAQGPE